MFDSLFEWIYELFYALDILVCKILSILYDVFEVFAGLKKVKYGTTDKYLINVFYDNSIINRVYWGMALIAIALCFGFTIMIVIKKMFDQSDKVKGGYGDIIRNGLKSILMILLLQFIMLATITMTNTLLQAVDNLFTYASTGTGYENITFDSEDYATMARILNTIGNYSVNPSSRSRYNINTCYNDIRQDMLKLYKKHIFEYTYVKEDASGQTIESWQSILSSIAQSHDLTAEADIDEYDASLVNTIGHAMDVITTSGSNFKPLKEQTWKSGKTPLSSKNTSIDRILFLTGSTSAAKNGQYNENASIFDSLRYPYLSGEKSIYDLDQVKKDFKISFDFGHLIVIFGGLLLCKQFLVLALNCVARIFNMMLLYIMAPPFLAAMPYDEGGKAKQWTTAFVVQSLSVFGSIVSVRLLMIFVPVIFDSKISLLGGGFPEIIAKLIFLFGAAFTCNKASAMISGILADSAGLQSVQAGDVGAGAAQAMGSLAKKGASIAGKPITAPLGAITSRAGKEMGDWAYGKVKQGGSAIGRGIGTGFKKLGAAMGIGGSKKGGSKQGQAGKNNNSTNNSGSKSEKNAANAKNDANTLGLNSGGSQPKNNRSIGSSGGSEPQNNHSIGSSGDSSSQDSKQSAGGGSEPQNNHSSGNSGSSSSQDSKQNVGGGSEPQNNHDSGGDSDSSTGAGGGSEPQNNNNMGEDGSSNADGGNDGAGNSKDLSNLFGPDYMKSKKGAQAKAGGSASKNSAAGNGSAGAKGGGGQPKNSNSMAKGGSASESGGKGSKGSGGTKNNTGKNKDLSNLFGAGYQNRTKSKQGSGNPKPNNRQTSGSKNAIRNEKKSNPQKNEDQEEGHSEAGDKNLSGSAAHIQNNNNIGKNDVAENQQVNGNESQQKYGEQKSDGQKEMRDNVGNMNSAQNGQSNKAADNAGNTYSNRSSQSSGSYNNNQSSGSYNNNQSSGSYNNSNRGTNSTGSKNSNTTGTRNAPKMQGLKTGTGTKISGLKNQTGRLTRANRPVNNRRH